MPDYSFLKHIDAVLIDLDGTLLNTLDDFVLALNRMLAHFNFPSIDQKEVSNLIGKGSEHLIASVIALKAPNQGQPPLAEALSIYQQAYAQINGQRAYCYPNAQKGVALLKQLGLYTACITNKPLRFAKSLLNQHQFFFDLTLGGDSLEKQKPDPLPLLYACEYFEIKPQQAVMIGDSENDAKAAQAANIPCLIVPYGYNHGQSIQTIPSHGIVEDILFAAQLIQNIRHLS